MWHVLQRRYRPNWLRWLPRSVVCTIRRTIDTSERHPIQCSESSAIGIAKHHSFGIALLRSHDIPPSVGVAEQHSIKHTFGFSIIGTVLRSYDIPTSVGSTKSNPIQHAVNDAERSSLDDALLSSFLGTK